jgi:DnaJ-class molecular chaperone
MARDATKHRHWPKTLYEVLGVSTGEKTRHELDRAKRMCLRFIHPDKNTSMNQDRASDQRRLIEVAHEILSDDAKREAYQRLLRRGGGGTIAKKNNYAEAAVDMSSRVEAEVLRGVYTLPTFSFTFCRQKKKPNNKKK